MDSSTVKSLSTLAAAFASARSTKFLPHSVGVSLCHEKKILYDICELYGSGSLIAQTAVATILSATFLLKINPGPKPQPKSSAKSDD
jgi:hypothetical protein